MQGGANARKTFEARVKSLMTDVPDLPNFSHFHAAFRSDAGTKTNEGNIRGGFFSAYDAQGCEYIRLADPEIDRRLKSGPDLVSASFVIPYPPGFPIMVPGQVITQETIDFMRKLDVKEIHGYDAKEGLKLVTAEALAKIGGAGSPSGRNKAESCGCKIVRGLTMQGFFHIPAAESVSAALLRRRPCGMDRARKYQGLRIGHGRRCDRGRRRALRHRVALRRETRAEQFCKKPVLLSLHVRRRSSRRAVLHQQFEG